MRLLRVAIGFLLLFGFAFGQKEIPMPTAKGNITLLLENIAVEGLSTSRLSGSLRNDTPYTLVFVTFEVIAYDETGMNVKMCDQFNLGLRCEFHVFELIKPSQTVRITGVGGLFHPDRPIPKKHPVTRIEYRVKEAPYYIKYKVSPAIFENSDLSILAAFDPKGISLKARNLSNDVIEVAWDQSVYIDETGTTSRLIKGNVRLAEKDRSQPNTVIPPGANVEETVFPINGISQDSEGKLSQKSLIPEIMGLNQEADANNRALLALLVGKEVRLFLRLLVNDQKLNVTLPFKILGADY